MDNPAAAETPTAPEVVEGQIGTLSDGTRILRRTPRVRSCGLKDAKGKLCVGHLKRWYFFGPEVAARFGAQAEVYRCEKCKTLYLPNELETPRTRTLCY
jgi:hypothetical protein